MHRGSRALVALIVACAALTVCAREQPASWRAEPIHGRRGTIRDREGRIVARDGESGREYPYGSLGAHAIGYVRASEDDAAIGRLGVEAAWDASLRASDGTRRVPLDAAQRELAGATLDPAIDGRDLTLTLDMELMGIVEHAFGEDERGAVVVIDVRDGALLALFGAPSFDPAALSVASAESALAVEASRVLVDPTLTSTYSPGGTIKPLTMLAGLEHGLDPSAIVRCNGRGEGDLDMRAAIATSCTRYPLRVERDVGFEGLAAVYRDFGLGSRTGLLLRDEAVGHVPTAGPWFSYDDPAIGQGEIAVTPIQLAVAYGAIANGGTSWRPRIVSSESVRDAPHVERHVHATAGQLAFLRDALDAAVNEPMGTAYGVRSQRLRVAGKTGHGRRVAQHGVDPISGWFAGYAPADDPQVAIVVLVDQAWSTEPAEVAIEILDQYFAAR